jgi:hypothetical protein
MRKRTKRTVGKNADTDKADPIADENTADIENDPP